MRTLLAGMLLASLANASAFAQDTLYDRAITARQADDPALAASLLENWLAENPYDVDALVQYGYALLALGKIEEAESAFQKVLRQAPEYADAAQGLGLVAARRETEQAARRGFLLVEGALSNTGGGQDDWQELGMLASIPVGAHTTLDLSGTWYRRFGTENVELGILGTHRATENLWLRAGASITPNADFRPATGISAGLDFRVASGTVASFDSSWQSYSVQDVWTARPGITQYFGGGRFAASLHGRVVAADGADAQIGGALRADYIPTESTRLFIGATTGPDTDLGVVRDTTSIFAGGELLLTQNISLTGSVAQEWRENGFDRTEGRIGVKISL
ncbi:YaiO family outer membrane beta-barrel protein [Aurantiacibacter rhizosphaerae]|uniref:YaiO family outer membrane beta-barrel protein n=1 Tax=Aurantiacibacter rhizosphaerae TaxID=2691582 RepID=A0A844XBY1_9SPHN|nr:YaiO family outer membrane beta-barrel protein [Aurantiacibacter rhizosphaerae]MWV27015.1 YaiO family outer membrane beta-barrel protein [Aurantiacibacter rhizosphaerae]